MKLCCQQSCVAGLCDKALQHAVCVAVALVAQVQHAARQTVVDGVKETTHAVPLRHAVAQLPPAQISTTIFGARLLLDGARFAVPAVHHALCGAGRECCHSELAGARVVVR